MRESLGLRFIADDIRINFLFLARKEMKDGPPASLPITIVHPFALPVETSSINISFTLSNESLNREEWLGVPGR